MSDERHMCLTCQGYGKVPVPEYHTDVESWRIVQVTCPVCAGRRVLSADEWAARIVELSKHQEGGTHGKD